MEIIKPRVKRRDPKTIDELKKYLLENGIKYLKKCPKTYAKII